MTRGGPGAAPGRATGAEAAGHMAAPELPRAGQRELRAQDTWRPRSWPGPCGSRRGKSHAGACNLHVSPSVLTWNLYAEVPGL
jgi:hypothetical protein